MSEFTPAFPSRSPDDRDGCYTQYYGMSLRDYFAAKAIPECINTEPRSWKEKIKAFLGFDYIGARPSAQGIAKDAYAIADAMLQEREKRNV